jgi:hypothetical protein
VASAGEASNDGSDERLFLGQKRTGKFTSNTMMIHVTTVEMS